MKKKGKNSAVDRREAILGAHEIHEESRADDDKFWSGLWHATIPREFFSRCNSRKIQRIHLVCLRVHSNEDGP